MVRRREVEARVKEAMAKRREEEKRQRVEKVVDAQMEWIMGMVGDTIERLEGVGREGVEDGARAELERKKKKGKGRVVRKR